MKNKFRGCLRRLLGLALAVGMILGGAVTAWADAISTYSISMGQNTLSVLRAGTVTSSYRTLNNDLTVMTADDGGLLVGFNNSQGDYVAVALGSQKIVNFYGPIGTLLLDRSLDRPVVIGSSARVTKLKVNAPVKVSVWGRVDSGVVDAAASIVTAKGSQLSNLDFENSAGQLYINEGSVVDGTTYLNSNSGSSSSSGSSSGSSGSGTTSHTVGGITLKTTKINANYDDTLSDLQWALEESVTAYNRNGKLLYGRVEWTRPGSTAVDGSGQYRFRFIPDNDNYDTVTSTVRVVVSSKRGYAEVYLDIDDIEVSNNRNPKRLSYYKSKLENHVKAYNSDGRRIYGEFRWLGSNVKVDAGDSFEFVFIPYSSKYKTVRDSIYIDIAD